MLASNSLETPVLGLVGRGDEGRFDAAAIRDRLARGGAARRAWPASGSKTSSRCWAASSPGRRRLRRFAGETPPPTPTIVRWWRTARRASPTRPTRCPRDRLLALLRELSRSTLRTVGADRCPTPDPAWPRRLAAYWAARDRFIESGRDVRPSPRVQDMLAQVREPLLSVLRISPDFRPAYDPLLSMAAALARSDAAGARTLLTELTRIQPARAEATARARVASSLPSDAEPGPLSSVALPEVGERSSIPGKQLRDGRRRERIRRSGKAR